MKARETAKAKSKAKQIPPLRRSPTATLWEEQVARGFGRDDNVFFLQIM
jgi:hypothetical protein